MDKEANHKRMKADTGIIIGIIIRPRHSGGPIMA